MSNLVGNGLLGKRKSLDFEEEEEFSWTKSPVTQKQKSQNGDKMPREDSRRGLNGSPATEVRMRCVTEDGVARRQCSCRGTKQYEAF